MTYNWDFVTNGEYYNYEANHVIFPMLLAFMYQTDKSIKYWNTAFFTFSFVAFWEVLEMLSNILFGSYLLFAHDNDETEDKGDIVILDLGNGILGIMLALLVLNALKPTFQNRTFVYRFFMFILYGSIYSALSAFGRCQNNDCSYIPYGNIANYGLILIFGYVLYQKLFNRQLSIIFVLHAIIYNSVTMIHYISSAIMVYITTAILLLLWSVLNLQSKNIVKYETLN